MTTDDRTKLISQLLALESPETRAPDAVEERSVWLWDRLANHLTPLIGQMGFESLYARAVHFSQSECQGLSAFTLGQETDFLQKLREDIRGLEHDTAERCTTILLNKFIELVTAMIGEALMGHILRSAWDEYSARYGTRGVSE
ncbi:hypothetical protein RY831_28320 [Noviherbaspirillum sp. CPCC 100848]|uniref:Uncharacterized protein n=1 Tax=Noviherbaspirillum album TaxID=3080276 RepID=A0ABU6JHE9_9BURK|nr:hypothetical protein [Noviherbaspirillum sp. CPCC 100848]MEC4723071.1 hypothetical protein [Noviherbaspirillum sp. CPCC 100848]